MSRVINGRSMVLNSIREFVESVTKLHSPTDADIARLRGEMDARIHEKTANNPAPDHEGATEELAYWKPYLDATTRFTCA